MGISFMSICIGTRIQHELMPRTTAFIAQASLHWSLKNTKLNNEIHIEIKYKYTKHNNTKEHKTQSI